MEGKTNVLVTGGTGFVGKQLVKNLLGSGNFNIKCLVRPRCNLEPLLKVQKQYPDTCLEIVFGDLKNGKSIESAIQDIDIVYHLAAQKNGPIASLYANTVVGTKNLLEKLSKKKGALQRFVHVSSIAVYDTPSLPRGAILNETTPVWYNFGKGCDGYAYVKLKQEKLIRQYAERVRIPFVVLRLGLVYGPGGPRIPRRIGYEVFGWLINVGRENVLPLTYLENCAEAIMVAGTAKGITGETINIIDDDMITCNEYLNRYRQEVKRIKVINCPYNLFLLFSWAYYKYCKFSRGQLPEVFTPYKTSTIWKKHSFANCNLRDRLGYSQGISTCVGLEKTFKFLQEKIKSSATNPE